MSMHAILSELRICIYYKRIRIEPFHLDPASVPDPTPECSTLPDFAKNCGIIFDFGIRFNYLKLLER